MVYTYNRVGKSAMIIKMSAPKYLPNTICKCERGLVSNNSNVPCFLSSEKLRMVTAGIKKIKIHGANKKKGDISAKPKIKILKSPLKTHKNKPLSTRKIAMTKYPMGEAKNELISFLSMANINAIKS